MPTDSMNYWSDRGGFKFKLECAHNGTVTNNRCDLCGKQISAPEEQQNGGSEQKSE